MNEIVNSRLFKWSTVLLDAEYGDNWLYVGRGKGDLQPSPLGNQNRAWEGDAVAKFRVDLWELMKAGDEAVLNELAQIGPDTVLVCHCDVPEKCHAFVIANAAAYQEANIEP